jgi:TRAP-type C4-dicarboxylate transport system permease small subunit
MFKIFNVLSKISVFIGVIALLMMVLVMTVSVACRIMGINFIGNVEMVEISLLVLVLCSLTYAQSEDKHITIGIIVDHLPKPIQHFLDLLSYVAIMVFCFVVAYSFMLTTIDQFSVTKATTTVFAVPLYLLKFIVVIGFFLWGVEAIHRFLVKVKGLIGAKESKDSLNSNTHIEGEELKV